MQTDLNFYHKTNMIIWGAILSGMVILFGVTFVLDKMEIFAGNLTANPLSQVFFIIAIILAFSILFLKRVFFIPEKIVGVNKLSESEALGKLRRNYIMIWSLGEVICLLGFIDYILTVNFRSFLIYAVVGIYAVGVSMPRKTIAESCASLAVK